MTRFACPVCSAVLKSTAPATIRCPRCGCSYERSLVDSMAEAIAAIPRPTGGSPDRLAADAERILQDAGLQVRPMGAKLRSAEAVRVLASYSPAWGGTMVVLVSAPWTQDLVGRLFDDLLVFTKHTEDTGISRFQFVSPEPPPPRLRYVFAGTKQGRFERLAIMLEGNPNPEMAVDPACMRDLARLGASLAQPCFRWEVNFEDLNEIKRAQDLILTEFREPASHDAELPEDTYVPHMSLLLFAALSAELLLSRKDVEGAWVSHRDWPFGVGLKLRARSGVIEVNATEPFLDHYRRGTQAPIVDFMKMLILQLKS